MKDDFDKWPCDAGHHDNCIGQIVDPSGATWGRCPCECHKMNTQPCSSMFIHGVDCGCDEKQVSR